MLIHLDNFHTQNKIGKKRKRRKEDFELSDRQKRRRTREMTNELGSISTDDG